MSEYIYEHSRCHDQFGKPLDAPMLTQREEIVRCRDCKHYRESMFVVATDVDDVCTFFGDGVKVEPDGFCAWGERRGDAE